MTRVVFFAALLALWTPPALGQGPVGDEFQVNTYTTADQDEAAVDVDGDGNFVVVWTSYSQDGDTYGVFGQRYDRGGNPAGGEFQVNVFTANYQLGPAIALDSAGNFVVVWESYGQDGSAYGVFGRRFESDGTPASGEFQVNTFTTDYQESPRVASEPSGDFVVVWESYDQDGDGYAVIARRYDDNGTPASGEFPVNEFTTGDQDDPDVAVDADGNFVIVWESEGQDGDYNGVFGQRYDSDGAEVGGEFRVNTYTTESQYDPRVAIDEDGDFVVVWESYGQDGDGTGVFAQRYDRDGNALGDEFQVNTYTTNSQADPDVAAVGVDNFVVTWESSGQDGSSSGIYARRYDGAGNPLTGEFRVNTYTPDSQDRPAVAMDDSGNFVVAWESDGQDGDADGIFAQWYSGLYPGCRGGEKQKLDLKEKGGKLKAKLSKGDATSVAEFGDPTAGTSYQVCLYDEEFGLGQASCAKVPAGDDWKANGSKGFTFKGDAGGITDIKLKAGDEGKTKVDVKGKDLSLELPLVQDDEVVLQLSNTEGFCWELRFADAQKNDEKKFKAK